MTDQELSMLAFLMKALAVSPHEASKLIDVAEERLPAAGDDFKGLLVRLRDRFAVPPTRRRRLTWLDALAATLLRSSIDADVWAGRALSGVLDEIRARRT